MFLKEAVLLLLLSAMRLEDASAGLIEDIYKQAHDAVAKNPHARDAGPADSGSVPAADEEENDDAHVVLRSTGSTQAPDDMDAKLSVLCPILLGTSEEKLDEAGTFNLLKLLDEDRNGELDEEELKMMDKFFARCLSLARNSK